MSLRKRVGALLVATVVALVGAIAIATPAHADSYLHRLIRPSGLCLEVPFDPSTGNGSMVMGEQLRLGICTNAGWYQKFWFEDTGTGANQYFLRPGHNSWCTQPGAPSLANSTIIQWSCTWANEQKWWLEPTYFGSTTYRLRNSGTFMCLGMTDEVEAVGTYVRQLSDCNEDLGAGRIHWKLG